MDSNISFDITTFMVSQGREKKITPNKDGVYQDVPIAVIGMVSRNNADYDVQSFKDAHESPRSRFFLAQTEGGAEGEWGHPFINENDEDKIIKRMAYLDRKNTSHYFRRVRTKPTSDGKYIMVLGDIKPCGPYGQFLKESFDDGLRNTAFSLRSLCRILGQSQGVIRKYINQLITYDAVELPGYREASVWFGTSNEGYAVEKSIIVDPSKLQTQAAIGQCVGLESITHQQILDMFCCDQVTVYGQPLAVPAPGKLSNGHVPQSVFHTLHH